MFELPHATTHFESLIVISNCFEVITKLKLTDFFHIFVPILKVIYLAICQYT